MSLYYVPVSVGDLTQLQLGIEFFSNTIEAITEAALITNPPHTATVSSYANQLLANNISLSQLAMAVDSLMSGVTDNVTELTKLSTQFLPPQVAAAVASGLNPTMYAAEALGLALAAGNGASGFTTNSHASFAARFGSLSVSQFASEAASLTGIDAGAIQGFAQNWINFYSANPSATLGLSVTVAAYGTAFGDAVGTALLNPTADGTTALLVSEVQNALIDNAEGLYKAGMPLILEPTHVPLQGEALLIPDAGGVPFGPTIDWPAQFGAGDYAQFVAPAQSGALKIVNAPGTFTLDTQHYGTFFPGGGDDVIHAAGNGSLFTLIVGDYSAANSFGAVDVEGYAAVHLVINGPTGPLVLPSLTGLVVNPSSHSGGELVISGSGSLLIGDNSPGTHPGTAVTVSVPGGTITDVGMGLFLGVTDAKTIDASNAPFLRMEPASLAGGAPGITVLGGTQGNELQGSLGGVSEVTFGNGTSGLWATNVGSDHITGGIGGGDSIFGDGGADTITLPAGHPLSDQVGFGYELRATVQMRGSLLDVLAITDGSDAAYPGFWGAKAPIAIPALFSGPTGGTSADMTTITGFHAGFGGDQLVFETAAWNGASSFAGIAANGDLVDVVGLSAVSAGPAQLSPVWVNRDSNSSLQSSNNVLLYAPAGGSPHSAQELAAQLHGAAGAVVLPGLILAGHDQHILVAYDASSNVLPILGATAAPASIISPLQHPQVVHIADVDLVNTSGSPQNSTFNLNVYASDMVSLTGVSLTSLTSNNIHFI
jgi:hypothetical protein